MGFGLRKSISLGGGMRVNISKGGIGMSGGIKGLRVGVNSRGAYMAGGSHGLYYRESLGGSSSSSSQTSENKNSYNPYAEEDSKNTTPQAKDFTSEVPADQLSGKNSLTTFYLISVPILFFIMIFTSVTFLMFFIYLVIGGIVAMIASASKVNKNKQIIQAFSEAIKNEPLKKAEELLPQINEMDSAEKQRILISNYSAVIDRVFKDQQISSEEEFFIKKYSENLPEDYISQANDVIISEIIKLAVSDNVLSEEEENLINRCFSTFRLSPSRREEFTKTIQEYKNLAEYEKTKFESKPITLTSLPKISSCLYESSAEFLKEKTTKGHTELIHEDSGVVVLTETSLEMVRTGHKSLKYDSIISTNKSWNGDVIEIVVMNKKTPYYIKVSDPIIFIAVISKMING